MQIDGEHGVRFSGRNSEKPEKLTKTGIRKYGDVVFSENWTHNDTYNHITIQLENGPKFTVKSKIVRKVLSFGVLDITGLSKKVKIRKNKENYKQLFLDTWCNWKFCKAKCIPNCSTK